MSSMPQRRGARPTLLLTLLVISAFGGGATAWLAIGSAMASAAPSSHKGPEGVLVYDVPNLAPAGTTSGQTIDGISCRKLKDETVKYHVHVHVAVYVNGKMLRLPAGIGITKPRIVEKYKSGNLLDIGLYDCLYALHTHVPDGIVHVEAPSKQAFTLGDLFDIWIQPLGPSQVGPAKGKVVVFENGKRIVGNPRSTPLLAQGAIQIDVGSPVVPFQPVHFKVTGGCGQGTLTCSSPPLSTPPT
ncbi:MAG TPA: hypothetical protein VII65_01190 [Acidimicrobiales bacterium]